MSGINSSGFIKIHRKLLEWEWFQDPNMLQLFLYILLKANYKKTSYKGVDIDRGQLLTGRISLSEGTGISQQTIRTCLSKLKKSKELTIKSTNKYSVITVIGYDSYQDVDIKSTSKLTNNQPATNQQLTTSKEGKEVKKVKNSNKAVSTTPICKNFKPSKRDYELLAEKGIAKPFVDSEINDFIQYWLETGEKKKSWNATFRTRVRTQNNYAKKDNVVNISQQNERSGYKEIL